MPTYTLSINGKSHKIEVPAAMPLLWILRDELQYTGTKYGCGVGACGACTVQVDGQAYRSCLLNASFCEGKKVTTVEGLSEDATHPVQQAWIELNVPQCGYCQSGQMMAATALLKEHPEPTDEQIDAVMSQIICRCGTYYRIRQAIHKAAELNSLTRR
ncbi:Isoquinoline 1-oxidoreductase [Flammeovirgaceae bacterium 311]|nr:Isoquinoline 1-oxidoreductase [Flammeovirgaceae bacterium 311]